MLLRVTKICCARLEAVQISQICDLLAATFIIPMPVGKGQAGGGVEFLTRTMPVPLAKIPATQVVPQDVKARHVNTTTALRNVFRILRGRHRMGLLQAAFTQPCADGNSAWDSMLVRGLAQEGRFYFSREAAHGNGGLLRRDAANRPGSSRTMTDGTRVGIRHVRLRASTRSTNRGGLASTKHLDPKKRRSRQ
jgi:hypothetical protein